MQQTELQSPVNKVLQKKFTKTQVQQTAVKLFAGNAAECLLYGGSRSGKTFITIWYQVRLALRCPGSRHLIARHCFAHVCNSVWHDTLRKVLKTCYPEQKVIWRTSNYFVRFDNGSELWVAGLDDHDRTEKILGMEFLTVFLNEASQIPYASYTLIKTRLAQKIEGQRTLLFVDANPPSKKHWLHKVFIENIEPEGNTALAPTRYAALQMNPAHNLDNLEAHYLETLATLPLRKRQRFLAGEFADDSDATLWTDDIINTNRVRRLPDGALPISLKRIVVAIDPAVSSKDTSDETGIIVAGLGFDNHLYVLADDSGIYTPNEWARRAIALFNTYRADRVIGEVNNGGDLIEAVLRGLDNRISYKAVHATRDKLTRAEPIAALYEQGRVHHVDMLLNLELEMTAWEARKAQRSPNRIDALVWAATELCHDNKIITGRANFNFKTRDDGLAWRN